MAGWRSMLGLLRASISVTVLFQRRYIASIGVSVGSSDGEEVRVLGKRGLDA
jgi:hypothetical protein